MDIGPEADSRSLLQFFMMSGRLKSEMRRGWVKKLGMARPESVADHSYRTALITLIFSDSQGLDTAKALRLALLHDLPEAIVGDAMPEERSGRRKIEMETKAMAELLAELPEEQKALYPRGLGGVRGRQDPGGAPGAAGGQAGDGDTGLGICKRERGPLAGEGLLGLGEGAGRGRGAPRDPLAGRALTRCRRSASRTLP